MSRRDKAVDSVPMEMVRAMIEAVAHHLGPLQVAPPSAGVREALRDALGASTCYCGTCQRLADAFWAPREPLL